jgi:hypothetical protein
MKMKMKKIIRKLTGELKKNYIFIIFISIILINLFVLYNVNYGLWLFCCLTLWIFIVLLIWFILYRKFKIKGKFKNPYTLLLINSIFILCIFPIGPEKYFWFSYLYTIQIIIVVWIWFLWNIRNQDIKANDGKIRFNYWIKGKRYKFLQVLMVFFIIAQAIVIFPYVFEPVLAWKSEQNRLDIENTAHSITKNYDNNENKTVALLNWFERHSGNMYNNYGQPTFITGFNRPMCLSIGDGHNYFFLSTNLYIRPLNRDYPGWVFTTRSGRCDEHSILFREMANYIDLDVRSVICKEMDHLWAEVLIDGNWTVVDPSNVVHNKIWKDANFSGYNLYQYDFLDRFTRPDNISYIFAEYVNGTKKIVTDRYIPKEDISHVSIEVVSENNNPVSNVPVEILSNNRRSRQNIEFKVYTDNNGLSETEIGKGSLTFTAKIDGLIPLYGENTTIIGGNETVNVIIVLKNDYSNLILISLAVLIIIIALIVIDFKRKKGGKKMNDDENDEDKLSWFSKKKDNYLDFTFVPTLTSGTPIFYSGESSATYYPAGSALLDETERNYDNYKGLFGDNIEEKELEEIDNYNKNEAKKQFNDRLSEYTSMSLKYQIYEKILVTGIIAMIFSIPIMIFISGSIQSISQIYILTIILFYISTVLITKYAHYSAIKLNPEVKKLQIKLDLTKFKGIELDME